MSCRRRTTDARRTCVRLRVVCLVSLSSGGSIPVPRKRRRTDRDRAAAAARRTADRLRALQREADSLAAQERTLLVELRKLEVDRQIAMEQLGRIERDRPTFRQKLDAAEARAAALARAAAEQRPDVEARLVQLYKLGRAGYWRLLLDVDDLRSLGRAYRTAAALTAIDRERVHRAPATLEALARERKSLQARADRARGASGRCRAPAPRG